MVNELHTILLRGPFIQVLAVVALAGAAASLTSCTLARLPVLLGLVSSRSEARHRGLLLSFSFSCGLIVSYTLLGSLLGVMAHVAAKLVAISEILYLVFGVLMILAGLFFAGLLSFGGAAFQARCETAVQTVKTLPSAFIFGMIFAFLEMPACPCCGAVLLLIASLIAIKGSLIYSGIVFFFFALGQSLPVLLIGFSSSLFKQLLPKTQRLEGVVSFCVGSILIVTGIFLVTLA